MHIASFNINFAFTWYSLLLKGRWPQASHIEYRWRHQRIRRGGSHSSKQSHRSLHRKSNRLTACTNNFRFSKVRNVGTDPINASPELFWQNVQLRTFLLDHFQMRSAIATLLLYETWFQTHHLKLDDARSTKLYRVVLTKVLGGSSGWHLPVPDGKAPNSWSIEHWNATLATI